MTDEDHNAIPHDGGWVDDHIYCHHNSSANSEGETCQESSSGESLCAGCGTIVCDDVPADYCSGKNARKYTSVGYCNGNVDDGAFPFGGDEGQSCQYPYANYYCKWGCVEGDCVPSDACNDSPCDSPPSSYCQEGGVAKYDDIGGCHTEDDGTPVCDYGMDGWTFCENGCEQTTEGAHCVDNP
jgi:hypothetical protein